MGQGKKDSVVVVKWRLRDEKKLDGLSVCSLQDSVLGNELIQILWNILREALQRLVGEWIRLTFP